jgi:Kdo2-lipid IVA lauroyltransferase/acyltransferase
MGKTTPFSIIYFFKFVDQNSTKIMINKGLSWIGIFFLYLLSLLPFWFLYLIADVLFFVVYHVTGYRKKVVRDNLRNSFPEKTDAERLVIEKKYFRYLADLIVETVKMITVSKSTIRKRITATNPEVLDSYLAQGRSIITALGHYGNWEIANLGMSIHTGKKLIVVYKPLTNITFDQFFIRMRSRFGALLIAMKNIVRVVVQHKNEITITALVADQTPVQHEATYFTTFLNQPTAFFLGIEKLAKLTNPVVLFCDVQCVKRGNYSCTFIPLTDNPKETAPYEITQAYVKYLEIMIRRAPEYWLWSHRRWKFKPEDKNIK